MKPGMLTYTARIWLHVDTPLGWVKVEGGQSTLAAEHFELIDVLVTTIVTCSRETFGVLVGQDRAIRLHRSQTRQILLS